MKNCPTCQLSYPNHFAACPQDGTPLVHQDLWSDGAVIRGRYRLICKMGEDDLGTVYKALDLRSDKLRTLKVIAPELLSDELFVKRFKHEASITRRLRHPNAVLVDDIDEAEDGRPFIVMEFIAGKSLKDLVRAEGPLPSERALSIIKQIAAALDAANRLGMIHRDIRADNIVLVDTPEGEIVKVLDFGMANVKEVRRQGSASLTSTGAGVVIATPEYMSPEQAMGKRGEGLDGRADLYSLGVVMYEMLTAAPPFKSDSAMEMLLAHMQQQPAPIRVAHPELQVPGSVTDLTMRLLEKNRDNRPASAGVLIQEIEKVERDLESSPATRVLTSEDLLSPDSRRGRSGGDQGTEVFAPTAQPAPPPMRPVAPPRPAPPPPLPPSPATGSLRGGEHHETPQPMAVAPMPHRPTVAAKPQESVAAAEPLRLSLARPRRMSKGHASWFLVQFFVPQDRSRAQAAMEKTFGAEPFQETSATTELAAGLMLEIHLSSPEIEFSDPVITKIESRGTKATFWGKPKDTCNPGNHPGLLSIRDARTRQEYESITFSVEVVDYAFYHVSRPLLAKLASATAGLGAVAAFVLTFLGQIDKTFGLASGTAGGAVASYLFGRVAYTYHRPSTTTVWNL